MSWNYDCIYSFQRAFDAAQNSSTLRDSFQSGIMDGSIFFNKLGDFTFDIGDTMRREYMIEQMCRTVISTMPAMTSCGADLPLVGKQADFPPQYFSAFEQGVELEACRTACGKDTLIEDLAKQEKSAGAGFGQLIDQVFLYGMPSLGYAGITGLAGNHLMDLENHATYGDLTGADPDANALANYFMYITHGMTNPVICMGSAAMELIGYRKMSQTGDSCGNLWTCVESLLASRGGSNIVFDVDPMFDFVTGINPADPEATNSVMWAYDRGQIRMGLESNESRDCSITKGHDIVAAQRKMHMTGPQIRKLGSSRWIYNFIDQSKIEDSVGDRYKMMCGENPSFTVATPIIA